MGQGKEHAMAIGVMKMSSSEMYWPTTIFMLIILVAHATKGME